jgi:CheY-like chemotaxis protein
MTDTQKAMLEGSRVLIVDDDLDLLQVLGLALEMKGARVRCASAAQAALAEVASFHPQVIVSDLAMPEMTGFDLIRAVRSLPPDAGGTTAALAISADRGAEAEARRCGFDAFLPKPVYPEGLVATVSGLLDPEA